MTTPSDRQVASDGDGTSGRTGSVGRAVAAVAALGGFGGLAALVLALTGVFSGGAQPDPTPPPDPTPAPTTASPSPSPSQEPEPVSSVRIEQPAARGDDQAEIALCQEFRGSARLADGYTLWLAGRHAEESRYTLFGKATLSPSTGKWRITAQVGGPSQTGEVFEIVAVPVTDAMSRYLLDATDYQGRRLVPGGDGSEVVGLLAGNLPPDSDTRHADTVKVRRGAASGGC